MLRDGTFTSVKERIFLLDQTVDCFVWEGLLFVLRKNDFRRIFDQLEQVRERARQVAVQLNDMVPIANFTEFQDACSKQAALADQLVAALRRDYFSSLSYEMLEPVIAEFKLNIPSSSVTAGRISCSGRGRKSAGGSCGS